MTSKGFLLSRKDEMPSQLTTKVGNLGMRSIKVINDSGPIIQGV